MAHRTRDEAIARLELSIAEQPADESRWKVYADALAENGALPEYFAHALRGLEIPELRFFSELETSIRYGDLQLQFNKFYFIEEAWLRPPKATAYAALTRELLECPAAKFIQALHIDLFQADPPHSPHDRTGRASELLLLLQRASAALPALRTIDFGYAFESATPFRARERLAAIAEGAHHLKTTSESLVTVIEKLQLRVLKVPPDSLLKPGAVVSNARKQFFGAPPREPGAPAADMHGRPDASGSWVLNPLGANRRQIRFEVREGVARLNGCPIRRRRGNYVLLPGDIVELPIGFAFQVEGIAAGSYR